MNQIKDYFSNWFGSEEAEITGEIPSPQWEISGENFSLDGPIPVDASSEDKYICRCGQSKNYPYCDNSHLSYNQNNGTNIGPLKINQEKDRVVYVCRCGHSKERPFCGMNKNDHENVIDYVFVVMVFTTFAIFGAKAYETH
ncbi:hypothetical protein PPL_08860 [Heterostelium album PN500]|uniref:Iron-binding zinc finger CDGSH type domain-containing protein n=1 Tax=Heterostelium pallidum (strain ATCC 26659 / Pp 5 / PN500) TaxID=670386 RepID=D3BJY0_HETP5|nr:hypothetical protein PPL_08860 [Heterostelium album PN500]EFA78210.1 hypothetical protein PPL_08860 [Heterostelium album PN500]|eukprot:XP_020430336.1 hypothetical protein PPL_08860 [Heterostelium album PN500]